MAVETTKVEAAATAVADAEAEKAKALENEATATAAATAVAAATASAKLAEETAASAKLQASEREAENLQKVNQWQEQTTGHLQTQGEKILALEKTVQEIASATSLLVQRLSTPQASPAKVETAETTVVTPAKTEAEKSADGQGAPKTEPRKPLRRVI